MSRFCTIKLFFTVAALTMFQFGCGDKPTGKGTGAGDGTGGGHGHAHHHHGELKAGPHGGAQTELEFKDKSGAESHMHLEVVVDHEKKSVTLYVLGEDSKTPTPINPDSPIELNVTKPTITPVPLTAAPLAGEKDGLSSVYTATNDVFATEGDFEGTIAIQLDGKVHQPKFKIEDHDHDHDHKDEAKKDDKK